MLLHPDTYMYDAYIYVPRSLTLMHVCMMHISMILDLDPEACMYVYGACIYDAANFVTDQRTDGRIYIYAPQYMLVHKMHIYTHDACTHHMHVCRMQIPMMYVFMMHVKKWDKRTDERKA